jgi:enoyl-CoA hydratase/carnithine racemase
VHAVEYAVEGGIATIRLSRGAIDAALVMMAGLPPAELAGRLRELTDLYHLALNRLTRIDAPVVCAVRGAAAGGGLGLVHVADVVIAAEDSKFALGYAAVGLAADGGNTWFLPRVVGMRRAQQLLLLNRVLTGPEALEWGLVTGDRADDRGRGQRRRRRGHRRLRRQASPRVPRALTQSRTPATISAMITASVAAKMYRRCARYD